MPRFGNISLIGWNPFVWNLVELSVFTLFSLLLSLSIFASQFFVSVSLCHVKIPNACIKTILPCLKSVESNLNALCLVCTSYSPFAVQLCQFQNLNKNPRHQIPQWFHYKTSNSHNFRSHFHNTTNRNAFKWNSYLFRKHFATRSMYQSPRLLCCSNFSNRTLNTPWRITLAYTLQSGTI